MVSSDKKNHFFGGGRITNFRGPPGDPPAKNVSKIFFSCIQDQLRKSQEVSTIRLINKDEKLYHFQNAGHYGPPHV